MAHEQSIQKFYRTAQARDFARNFSFRVHTIMDRGTEIVSQDDLVYITTANIPGRTITALPMPYMGLDFQLPGAAKYENSSAWPVTFRADGSNIIRSLFERWTFLTFDDQTSTGTYRLYQDSIIRLTQLDQDLNPLPERYKLIGVFPTSVGSLGYEVTGNGDPINLEVSFAYQYWVKE